MTRDYARPPRNRKRKQNTRVSPASGSAPGWLWGVAGVLVGMLAMALIKLGELPPPPESGAPEKPANQQKNDAKPRFDFYTLLRETEVMVPEGPAEKPRTEEAPATGTHTFILQAGSFKSAQDADSLRARLLLLNMTASVEKVTPRPGETWHRVLVGPFESSSLVAEARATLAENGIDNILLKRLK